MMADCTAKKKNILIVHNYYKFPGGEDTVVANEKTLLESRGHKVVLYTRNNAELEQQGALNKILLPINTIFSLRTYKDVKRIIKEQKIDILHVHNTLNMISPSVYYAGFHSHIPVIQTMHNFRLLCPGALFYRDGKICEECLSKGLSCSLKYKCYRGSFLQTLASVITLKIHRALGTYKRLNYICLTEFNRKKLLSLKCVDSEKVFIKPHFTVESNNTRKERKKDYFLFLGRVEKIKGIEVIIEAFQDIPYTLKIVGTGEEEKRLRSLIEEKHCHNIEFVGYQSGETLDEILSGARALVSAPQLYETFGMTVIEAYAHRVPVIVGNIGNVSSLVEDGVTGLKFQYDSPDDLRRTIEEFMGLDCEMLGENAYKVFQEKYSEEENYKTLMKIYDNAK